MVQRKELRLSVFWKHFPLLQISFQKLSMSILTFISIGKRLRTVHRVISIPMRNTLQFISPEVARLLKPTSA